MAFQRSPNANRLRKSGVMTPEQIEDLRKLTIRSGGSSKAMKLLGVEDERTSRRESVDTTLSTSSFNSMSTFTTEVSEDDAASLELALRIEFPPSKEVDEEDSKYLVVVNRSGTGRLTGTKRRQSRRQNPIGISVQ
ncbi:hypothetical protein PROFUN_10422 [Planoprotostelium fungivorum]|uniref:Uncharacterized protein n=1 Tax=Planoprotostelium fungivorum TaxID=1890364 RepID=A0A2P6NE22_9EUKA|nr:hypothetical protein PROFUN_10422 [Planoprotostelium fungivorum]